jgi:hypothetical protein
MDGNINDYISKASGQLDMVFNNDWNLYLNGELAKEIEIDGSDRADQFGLQNNLSVEIVKIGSLESSTYLGNILMNCKNLKHVVFKENSNIQSLSYTFNGCNIIGELDLSRTMLSSFYYSFADNKNLTKVILPATTTRINDFRGCENLRYIKVLSTTPPELNSKINAPIEKIIVPMSAVQDYKEAWTFYANIIEGE